MFDPDQYALLDFAKEQKTERFGEQIVLRETKSVADSGFRRTGAGSFSPTLSYRINAKSNDHGEWIGTVAPEKPWTIRHRRKCFLLKVTPAGQVGVFPEQAANWDWIETGCQSLSGLTGLNLFAYSGGTTLSLASMSASMVHVDSATAAVRWARQNAQLSGLETAPIRWIVEDAKRFLKRESSRGSKYDILVADPPSYGKGPKGESWKLADDLEELLKGFSRIAAPKIKMLILSCHTAGFDEKVLRNLVDRQFDLSHGIVEALPLVLETSDGRQLPSGHCVRFRSHDIRQ
jgi:23S rRNA (cytosine1962-C5)-methyltransferase